MSELTKKVDFNRIRYANCWEDADVLLQSLRPAPKKKILCIASGGDNALALLSTNPELIIACDLSAPQLYLTELKQMAFATLDYEALVALLGVTKSSSDQRVALYQKVRGALSAAAKNYWDDHLDTIAGGVIHAGKFEHFFNIFRNWMLPLVHRKKTIHQLLALKTEEAQKQFYAASWNTWRWKLLMNFFFSKHVLGKYGRDPEFLRHVTINVPQYIRQKTEAHLQQAAVHQNYFLHFILTDSFGPALPFYLRRENFGSIRNNIHQLKLVRQDATDLFRTQDFDICCLSNIFEYIAADEFAHLTDQYAANLKPGAQLAFWNLMAPRSFSETNPRYFRMMPINSRTDNGFFYSRFLTEERL